MSKTRPKLFGEMKASRFFLFFELLFLTLLTLTIFSTVYEATHFSDFMTRDIGRAHDLLNGILIWHGPETSNGFKLPGPFYYYLLAAPQFFFHTWKAIWLLMILMHAMAVGCVWLILREIGYFAALVGCFLVLTNQVIFNNLVGFWNPSFLLLFLVLGLHFLLLSFSSQKSSWHTWAFFFVIALAGQIHFIVAFILLPAFLLCFFSLKVSLPSRPKVEDALKGASLLGVMWSIFEILSMRPGSIHHPVTAIGFAPHINLSLAGKAFATVFFYRGPFLYILISSMVGAFIFLKFKHFSSKKIVKHKEMGIILFVCVLISFFPILTGVKADIPQRGRYLLPLAFFSVLLISYLAQIIADRWSTFIYVVAAIGVIEIFYQSSPAVGIGTVLIAGVLYWFNKSNAKINGVLLVGIFLFIVAVQLNFYHWRNDHKHGMYKREDNFLLLPELEFAAKKIYELTGWSYEEARYRMLFLNQHITNIPKPVYEEQSKVVRMPVAPRTVSGIFIALNTNPAANITDKKSFLHWLQNKDMEETILAAIKKDEIKLISPILKYRRVVLIPYHIANTSSLPQTIHNSGQSYNFLPLDTEASSNLHFFDSNHNVFSSSWNNCRSENPSCKVRVKLSIDNYLRPRTLQFSLHGELLSRPKLIATIESTAIQDLYLSVHCGNYQAFNLAKTIGYTTDDPEFFMRNIFMLSPLAWNLPLHCSGRIEQIDIWWGKSLETTNTKLLWSAGKKISFHK